MIQSHLKDLGFGQAAFEITIDPLNEPRAGGFETVEFIFAANLGEPLKPLSAVASSGEISRVMLAVKTAFAQQDLIGLLVFDEIDANVGGEIAHSIGAKMRSLGERRQVIAITHMPQVAAAATRHFNVSKAVTEGRTRTSLVEVKGEDRIEELARMLGGRTKPAIEHAKELLKRRTGGIKGRIQEAGVAGVTEWSGSADSDLGAANPYLCRRFATIRTCFAAVGLFSLNSCNSCNS